jgi:hypothetical protein
MRTALLSIGIVGLFAVIPATAAEQTWTGQISDSVCGSNHSVAEHGKKMSDRDCVQACVKKGAQYVFVADGKVYKLINHDAEMVAHAGHTVRLTGDLNSETIRISKIEMVSPDRKR